MSKKKIHNTLGRNLQKQRENDKITPQKRSNLMSKIRSKNTKFEENFINALREYTSEPFECNVKLIKGKPDIVFHEKQVCVFLDSDFWHGWQYPRWKHLLKNDFWRDKIEKNRKRDRKTTLFLRKHDWIVIRIWEHNIKKKLEKELYRILDEL